MQYTETFVIDPPTVKEIFRVKMKKDNGYTNKDRHVNKRQDAQFIIKFPIFYIHLHFTTYERNYVLTSIKNYVRETKDTFRLNLIGFDSQTPFFLNENLTPDNHRIFLRAHSLKKDEIISSAFTLRGFVYIKTQGSDEPMLIEEIDELDQFFQPQVSSPNVLH